MAPPVFTGAHFWVSDMVATMTFWRVCGLPIPDGAENQSFVHLDLNDGRSFEFGTYELTRRYDPAFEPSSGTPSVCLQFDLPSRQAVDDLYQKLTAAGHASHLAPIDAFWGARYAEVCDPDGNVVGFHSPRDPG